MNDKALTVEAATLLTGVTQYKQLRTVEEYAAAAGVLLQTKARLVFLEEKKKSLTQPAREVIKTATEMFEGAVKDYTAVEARLKALIADFVDYRVPEAMKEGKAALVKGDQQALMRAMKPIPNIPGMSLRTTLGFELDGEEVPKSYYLPPELNTKLIMAQLREGVVIPGVRMVERTQVAVTLGDV